jgi:hypothetical protein
MSAPAKGKVLGRWRIFASDVWEENYLDLVGPATVLIGADGHGELNFGCIQATLELEYGRKTIFFRWAGFDEGDEVIGSGSAELGDDGSLEMDLSFDDGDDVLLTARRE